LTGSLTEVIAWVPILDAVEIILMGR